MLMRLMEICTKNFILQKESRKHYRDYNINADNDRQNISCMWRI